MKIILDFLTNNYILLVMLAGMFLITLFDVYLDRSMIHKLRTVIFFILFLVIFDNLEEYTGNLDYFTWWRIVLSVLCYSLRPTIILMLIFIVSPKINKMIVIPALLNFLIVSSAFFTDIAFTIERDTNHFTRGILGYTPHIITVIYILTLYYITIKVLADRPSEEGAVLLFITMTATFSAVLTFFNHDEVTDLTYAVCILLYYMYLYAQYTKRDPLTSVFNRQTFHSDMNRHPETITGIISIDMNDLKWLNDNKGHQSGDKALIAISQSFTNAIGKRERVYRIGGDEFIIACRKTSADEIEKLLEKLKAGVAETGYSCAFGSSVNKSIDEMLEESDKLMYEDKARIKKELENQGIIHKRS